MSIFEHERSEDEPWIQKHKKIYQPPKKRRQVPIRPILLSGAKTQCPNCLDRVPMETIRGGHCLPCQVAGYLDLTH